MKRFFYFLFTIFTFLQVFSSIHAEALDFDEVFQSVKAGSEWNFVVAREKGGNYENLYAVNAGNPEKSSCVLKNPARTEYVFSNLCYNPKNETLYFCIHNGGGLVNGVQIFLGEGIYALKKDSDGNFSSKGVRRFTKMEPWLVERAKQAYFDKPPAPDYEGFLEFLFGFADFDAYPCLAYTLENGKRLLNEDALRYFNESGLLASLCSESKEFYHSRFEDFLFCLDENGEITKTPAVTANHSEIFYKEGGAFVDFHYLARHKGQIFMLEISGSIKKSFDEHGNVSNSLWSPDFSKIYAISDSEEDFLVYQGAGWGEIKADIFELPYPKAPEEAPIFEKDGELFLRGVNHSDIWQLQKDFSIKKVDFNSKKNDFSGKAIAILQILSSLLLALCVIFYLAFKKFNSAKFIFGIQQKTREEISSDIHDSVVQDIRAIRLDVERLKVNAESEELQKAAVNNLTECIKRMRDICYGLNPAEIAVAEITNSSTNIISVVQTLCENFSQRTKIQFRLDCEQDSGTILIETEKAKYVSRIVSEILSNVEKHSFATNLTLLIHKKISGKDRSLTFIFVDDGVGCDLKSIFSHANMKKHFGLRNMKKYAELCGGEIDFLSEKNEGMQVKLSVKVAD